ncbi:MAG: glycosyltransferase family 39 protein [Aggregatilineales bacterium]
MHGSTRLYVVVITVLLLFTALAASEIGKQSLWFDEGWSAYAAAQPNLIEAAAADATNPPLYYLLLHVWVRFLGESEFALRLFSLIAGLLALALAGKMARALFEGRAAVLTLSLGALSPLLWWAAREARMYTLLALLVAICALAWHRLLRRAGFGWWLTLWLAQLALLYAHNTGPVLVIWLNAVTLLAWAARRQGALHPEPRRWIAGQAAVLLLWLPYFFTRFLTLGEANAAVFSPPELSGRTLLALWMAFWQTPWERVLWEPFLPALYLGLLAAAVALIPWRRPAARWQIVHWLLIIVGLLAGLAVLGNALHGRYLVMVIPLLLVPIGAGIARLPRLGTAAVLLIFAGVMVLNLVTLRDSPFRHDDARAIVEYYAATLGAQDSVLMWSYADRYELAYYWERLQPQAERITLPEGADLNTILPLLPTAGDVSLNVWFTQRADYRGMLGCILGASTLEPPETFTVHGMTDYRFHDIDLTVPALTAQDQPFADIDGSVVRLVAAAQPAPATPDRALCLPLEIELLRAHPNELKAAVIALNAHGWEIARADAVFAQADQRTAERLSPGERMTAFPLLRFPLGTPPGDYRLLVRIYDEVAAPSGFEPVGVSAIGGRDMLLATWQALPGAVWRGDRALELETTVNVALADGLVLLAHSVAEAPVAAVNGERLRLTLLWDGEGELPALTLRDAEAGWSLEIAPGTARANGLTRDWRTVAIPADVPSGEASLLLPDGTAIARYLIDALPFNAEPSPFGTAVDAAFPGVGQLVGFSLEPVSLSASPQVTLVWRADDTTARDSYTVFVQLINDDGRVIAQSDALPAAGARPTSGWRPNEYIEDRHSLAYNSLAAPGRVRLIAGLYNALTGERVRTEDGRDAVELLVDFDLR